MAPQAEFERQCADAVLMIRPAAFSANPDTAATNRFQYSGAGAELAARARAEFDALAGSLEGAGVTVSVFEDSAEPPKPDACFPNNWVSFHADGTVVLYPLLAPNRRAERRPELIAELCRTEFRTSGTIDLTPYEEQGAYLEGTGSLVLDRRRRVAYACRSPRTCAAPLAEFAERLRYRIVAFDARGPGGLPVYHTNVLLSLGDDFAVFCADSLPGLAERNSVLLELEHGGRELIPITSAQMRGFAGNLLALRSVHGEPLITLSAAAWSCLGPPERRALERHGRILATPIPTIERYGGGSVRCMLAETLLPRRPARGRC